MSTPKDHCPPVDQADVDVRATEAPWDAVIIPWETYPPDWDDTTPVSAEIVFDMSLGIGGQVGVNYTKDVSFSFTHAMEARSEQIFLVTDFYFNTKYTIESTPALLWEEEQDVVTVWKKVDYPN
jgi:hypothetical protein